MQLVWSDHLAIGPYLFLEDVMKFRARIPHYLPGDRFIDANGIIEDANFTDPDAPGYYPPTTEMEPLDDEAKALVMKVPPRDIAAPIEDLPINNGNDDKLIPAGGIKK